MEIYIIDKKEALPGSIVAFDATIPTELFESYREQALKHIGEHIDIPGFRKGHIPGSMTEKHVSDMYILEEMAQIAISHAYPKMIAGEKIDAIGEPKITITKLAKGNPLSFRIETAVIPSVTLPDYKKLSQSENKTEEKVEVTDEEIEKTIQELRKLRAQKPHDHSEPNHTHEEIKEEDLPEVNDEFAKSFGEFENIDAFKAKIRENMTAEKVEKARGKKRMAIIEKVLTETKVEIPSLLIDSELSKMEFQMKHDISQMGMQYDDYLKSINKSPEEIKVEWRPDAEKRVKLELVLREIALKETLKPEEAEIEHQVAKILETYKDADRHRAYAYVEQTLTHEKVFQFLEEQK